MIFTTLLSTLFGGGGAIITNLIKTITDATQDKRDKAHELTMYQLQLDSAKLEAVAAIDAAKAQAGAVEASAIGNSIDTSIKSDNWLVAFLNGIIRPVTTICFTCAFFFFLYIVYEYAVNQNLPPLQILALPIFITFDHIFGCIMGFWFINRQLSK